MRILIAHSRYRIGGGEDRYVEQQAQLLSGSHQVHTLDPRNEDLSAGWSTAGKMIYSPTMKSHLRTVIDDFKPDVIHVHNVYPSLGPSVHLAARQADVPLIMTVHNFRLRCPNGYMFTEGEICSRCERGNHAHAIAHRCFPSRAQAGAYAVALWWHRFGLHWEDAVTCFLTPSEFMRSRLIDWGISSKRIHTVRNFTQIPSDASPAVGDKGLFLGRLSSEKGINVLLLALKMAGDPPFLVVGEGPMGDQLKHLAQELGLENTVFLGRVPHGEGQRLIRHCRYLVMPSLSHENAPMAVIEAMANGRPVAVAQRGGLVELVASGGGLSFPAADPEALAATIRRFLADDLLCDRSGREALRFARSQLTAEKHRAELESVYQSSVAAA